MKKQSKKYSKPRRPFDKTRIEEENVLKEKYGLKNKREIWKADAAIGRIRNLAKQLITKSDEEKQAFVDSLQKKGFQVESIAEALALDKENWLKRRLQTIVFAKKLTTTPKQSRQFVAHKHVSIGNQIVNIPSYQVSLEEEALVKLNIVLKQPTNKKAKMEKIKEDVIEGNEEEAEEGKIQTPEEINKEAKVEEKVEKATEEEKKEVKEENKPEGKTE
jgi:small subunit ribosomal protein S4|tara:strand:+ start:50 stop:703 length:654 start_codon:yes stop_codon:yes gene_type:complete